VDQYSWLDSADGLTGKPNMINRTLARRLEDLEAEFLPVASETTILRVDFVERDGTVVDHMDIPVKTPAPTSKGPRARPWWR
jgi:hypothetical protein